MRELRITQTIKSLDYRTHDSLLLMTHNLDSDKVLLRFSMMNITLALVVKLLIIAMRLSLTLRDDNRHFRFDKFLISLYEKIIIQG